MSQIAIVVPSCREDSLERFLEAWRTLFFKHRVTLIIVKDGTEPVVQVRTYYELEYRESGHTTAFDILGQDADLIFNKTDACRNLGFALIARHYRQIKYVISLDDDVAPIDGTDPIAGHITVLRRKVPIHWMNTAGEGQQYMRGFPYEIREEAPVHFSHGVWHGVPDLDAVTQLSHPELVGDYKGPFFVGPIPKGVLAPICGMNVAFTLDALPFVYYAPMGPKAFGLGRWADIFMGIDVKRDFDKIGWAMFTGDPACTINHTRASNVWKNLQQEAEVLKLNETYWKGDESSHVKYFKLYRECRERWRALCDQAVHGRKALAA